METRTRGRPRNFDPDQAVLLARQMFHERGYDALSVADMLQILGIKAPSFYAAFGSKAELFARVLHDYSTQQGIPLATILRDDRPVAENLTIILREAVERYCADPKAAGCMVIEGTHCVDAAARDVARPMHDQAVQMIYDHAAKRHPDQAAFLRDHMIVTMAGLSAAARMGADAERLRSVAEAAGEVMQQKLKESG